MYTHIHVCEYRYKRVNVNTLPPVMLSKLKQFGHFGPVGTENFNDKEKNKSFQFESN